jgi:hypothetical protein
MADNTGTVLLEGVRIIFRNFTGKEGQYNREGDRNFGVIIPNDEIAQRMLSDGWNVKYLKPREDDEDETETPWLSVSVNFDKGRPPQIFLISETNNKRTLMDANMVEMLDWADIKNVDMIVRPYHYEVSGRTGIKAYLQKMFVIIEEDELERKYADLDVQ